MSYRHLYVHVPFCARRCSYCDFAIAVRSRVPVDAFVESIGRELRVRGLAGDRSTLDTLYLGGGTPSRLGGKGIARLLDTLRGSFVLAPDAEVTIEANPDDVQADAVRAWLAAGVNRVSLGVQSFNPDVLAWMHRTHDAQAARDAAALLRDAGITNWSLDLIYALPLGIARNWLADVEAALALEPPHISAYGLTIEPRTPLDRWQQRGEIGAVDEDRFAEEFLQLHAWLSAAGYEHYEVSNFARPGFRARHNSAYWTGVPYLGVGPSAHGFDGLVRRWNLREFADWSERLAVDQEPQGGEEGLSEEQREIERVYLGLRTADGLRLKPMDALVTDRWVAEEWADVRTDRIVLRPSGWLRLDALAAALTEHRSHY